ncbi:MAG: histidine--tRNA ligase [Clostridia bacterium]|nr:histidine--tRNA ligase [Clostridia bacterium]
MKMTPVKGTNDYLVKETKLRNYMQNIICKTYENQGFNRIFTPILEDIENLEKSDGGENLNLIFKVLKRGDKLANAIEEKDFSNLADLGLRYDLTLPLSRFFAGHRNDLLMPFKVIQIGEVFRAERPQKGRNREFVQCDIDIIGTKSVDAEIELIDTTAQALLNLDLKNFTIRINDRRILKGVLSSIGFKKDELDSVCITFDKLDKIGTEGIKQELLDKNFSEKIVLKFCELVSNLPKNTSELRKFCGSMSELDEIEKIISDIDILSNGKYKIRFDLSLVRGQGYYTGAVFEIQSDDYSCSIGGGGRYDNLIGKFLGEDISAVGFSIGFERLFALLSEQKFEIKNEEKSVAVIYKQTDFLKAFMFAKSLKRPFRLFEMQKNIGKLLFMLEKNNYLGFYIFKENEENSLKIF